MRRIAALLIIGLIAMLDAAPPANAAEGQEGVACFFLAPSGALNAGHVGWAFSDAPDWTFGATEGVPGQLNIDDSANNHSWMTVGSFTDALQEFSSGRNLNVGPGYYTSYLCKPVSSSHPDSAMSKAITGASGYTFPVNDCLTKAVDILTAYGVDSLPFAGAKSPNGYIRLLPKGDPPAWSQIHSL